MLKRMIVMLAATMMIVAALGFVKFKQIQTAVAQGAEDKGVAYDRMMREQGLDTAAVCCVGDDLPDVPLLSRSGLGVAVADACAEAKASAHHVTTAAGDLK